MSADAAKRRRLPDRAEDLLRRIGLLPSRSIDSGEPPALPATSSDDAVPVITEIAVRGVEWRDAEVMRLADRAAALLAGGSIVVGVGSAAAFGPSISTPSALLLGAALVSFVLLAVVATLALRPRVLPRRTGYAVDQAWEDGIALQRLHLRHLRERAMALDRATRDEARLVELAAVLLALETLLLTSAILVQWI